MRTQREAGGQRSTNVSAPCLQGVPGPRSCTVVVGLLEDGLTTQLGLPSNTAGGGGTLPVENQHGVLLHITYNGALRKQEVPQDHLCFRA